MDFCLFVHTEGEAEHRLQGWSGWDRVVVFKEQCWQKQWQFHECRNNSMSRRDYAFNVFMPLSRMEWLCCLAIWH